MSEEIKTKKTAVSRTVKPKKMVGKITKSKAIKAKPEKKIEITATHVTNYLKSHPDFFIEHAHLLEHLSIPN